jgi:hypothetical protein
MTTPAEAPPTASAAGPWPNEAAAVVELYGLPPERFVAARNQLAKAVRDRGDAPAA